MSRNRCQVPGATSPVVSVSPRIPQTSAITSPTVTPGFSVPAARARLVSSWTAARISRAVGPSALRSSSRCAYLACAANSAPSPRRNCSRPVAARARQSLPGLGQRLAKRQPHELVDQRVLVGEPPVHGAHADPRPGGDLLHAGIGPGLAEHLAGRIEDPVVVADRVAPPGRGRGPRRVAHRGLAGHLPPHSPSSLATVSPAALSAVTASPDIARVPTAAASVAAAPGRRCDGISSAASAATTRTAAMTPNPVV